MNIKQALTSLDPKNDDQWTSDGLPRIDVLVGMTGQKNLKRKEITDADPKFTRVSAALPEKVAEPAVTDGGDLKSELEALVDEAEQEMAEPVAEPDPVPSILQMSWSEMANDEGLLEQYISEVGKICTELQRDAEELKKELKELYRRSEMATNRLSRIQKSKPNSDTSAVRAYLAMNARTRAGRSAKAQNFIKAGTTAEDVADQLSSKSMIDRAMSQRKPALGSTRPAMGLPVRK